MWIIGMVTPRSPDHLWSHDPENRMVPSGCKPAAVVKSRATATDLLSGVIARPKPRRVVFLSSYASYNFGELYAEERSDRWRA